MFGKKKCKHNFVEVARRFTPPNDNIANAKNLNAKAFDYFMYGFTTIEDKCEYCNASVFDTVTGDQR